MKFSSVDPSSSLLHFKRVLPRHFSSTSPPSPKSPKLLTTLTFMMLFSLTAFVTIFTLFTTTFSWPLVNRAPQHFQLRTRIVDNRNDTGSFKGKLWLSAWHTGAGTNDAVLLTNKSFAISGFLNDTALQFNLGSQFPWWMNLAGDTNYAAWDPVAINSISGPETGFSITSTGLQVSNETGFNGWLACDWYHGVPQLFYTYAYYNYTIPTSCSKVDLIPVPV